MPQPNFTLETIEMLSYLLDGQGQISITHDRPPNGAWFVEVTDTWTDMITKLFTHSDLSVVLLKAAEKKAKVLGVDLDELIDLIDSPTDETEEEEDE